MGSRAYGLPGRRKALPLAFQGLLESKMAVNIAYMMSTLMVISNNIAFCLSISSRFVMNKFAVEGGLFGSITLSHQFAAKLRVKDELKERVK